MPWTRAKHLPKRQNYSTVVRLTFIKISFPGGTVIQRVGWLSCLVCISDEVMLVFDEVIEPVIFSSRVFVAAYKHALSNRDCVCRCVEILAINRLRQ